MGSARELLIGGNPSLPNTTMAGRASTLPDRPSTARLAQHHGAAFQEEHEQEPRDSFSSSTMEKAPLLLSLPPPPPAPKHWLTRNRQGAWILKVAAILGLLLIVTLPQWSLAGPKSCPSSSSSAADNDDALLQHSSVVVPDHYKVKVSDATIIYGQFPRRSDKFHFLPCTNATLPPALNDTTPDATWAALYDPNPDHWSWGAPPKKNVSLSSDPYAGRGVYLCGYLDVPLDYTNASDTRITRLAVTKYQVSGFSPNSTSEKSERTLVIEPGGPGGSGTSYAWSSAEKITNRLSGGVFDVLGWDPRGVNASQPAVSCYPYDADRDRWYLLTNQFRAAVASPAGQLQLADAMNEAMFRACWELHGDLARFVGTSFVARDMEEIRKALGEDELTGYLVSYGTGIGQTYAGMFPDSVGRMILDGTEYVRDHRVLGGFGFTALDNVTDAWNDGFLGECLHAGAGSLRAGKARDGKPVVLSDLKQRMDRLISSLITRPVPGYSELSGPVLVTYSSLVSTIYGLLYNAQAWPGLARTLYALEEGNSTLAAVLVDNWYSDPSLPCPEIPRHPSSEEIFQMVVCADSYDAPQPADGLDWWLSLWSNMTTQSWIAGNGRFYDVFQCRQFTKYWPHPAEVFRGDLNHTLRHPVLLIAETYDPATPLRNGRRLASEMGPNARLIVHHGYGHSSRDTSNCTDSIARAYILNGTLPYEAETDCYANEKPYLYGVKKNETSTADVNMDDSSQALRLHRGDLAG